jgi:pectate lyase C
MTHADTSWPALLILALCGALGCAQDDAKPSSAPGPWPPSNEPETAEAGHDAAGLLDSGWLEPRQDAGELSQDPEDAGRPPREDAGAPDEGSDDAGDPMPDIVGDGGTVHATIVVGAGETFDGQGKRYRAGEELGDGSQSEGQKPVFRLEDGAKLVNVVLGAPAADGIHTYGDVTLEKIVWEDIGEDALTIKKSGTVVLDGGSATLGDDKVFQINAASTFRVSNFSASHAGKFIRQNGGTSYKVEVIIDRCDISRMDEAIFRTDSDVSTVEMTNTRYSNIGDELFMGVDPDNITLSNNTAY